MLDEELNEMDIINNHEESIPAPKRKSLGRGLGALLGDDDIDLDMELNDVEITSSQMTNYIDINSIKPSKYQPRTEFDEEALNALVQSIKEKGVLQPLLVRKQGNGFELIAGERRWRASKIAGLDKVPVIEKDLSDKEVLEVALVENLLRENLSAIEEAEGFQRLIDEFAHTQEALSQIVGKSRSHIANTLRLLNLPEPVKSFVKEGKLSAGHARALVGLENAEVLAKQIIAKDLNVRQVEELVAKQKDGKKETTTKSIKDEDISDIEKDLIKTLGLRIKISPSKQGGGKVVLQYSSVAELDMIVDILEQKRKNNNNQEYAENNRENAPMASAEKFTMKIID